MWKTIITRYTGTQETWGDEDYKLKPKQNHCYGHTPQIQKGAKTSNSGVERICHSLQSFNDSFDAGVIADNVGPAID